MPRSATTLRSRSASLHDAVVSQVRCFIHCGHKPELQCLPAQKNLWLTRRMVDSRIAAGRGGIIMKDHTRRAVAYIAGRLVCGTGSSSVYDYDSSKRFDFSGQISPTDVSVYDYEQRCYISGSGSSGSYSLFHRGNGKHITLNIEGGQFNGYDHDTRKQFTGRVSGNSVSIYDYEHSKYFNYSI